MRRSRYDKPFKESAVKLYLQGGKNQKEIAEYPGIDRSLMSAWSREYGKKNAFLRQWQSLRMNRGTSFTGN